MMRKPKTLCDYDNDMAVGSPNPYTLNKAKHVQPALYDGQEILKTHHIPVTVHDSEETLEIAEITRQKMNGHVCVEKKDFEKTCKKRITPTGITEGERGFEQTKRCYLTEVIRFFNLLKEHLDGVQKSLVKEVRAMKAVFENMEAEVDQNAIDKKCGEIERKNLLITNENLIANCIAQDVFYTATDSMLDVSRFNDINNTYHVEKNRTVELEAAISKLKRKIHEDDHESMVKHFSKLEIDHLNLQLKYQHLKEKLETVKSTSSNDVPEFDTFFKINK
ncbi:hypothetical protein Tco_0585613 [Tanacetum coccineum]